MTRSDTEPGVAAADLRLPPGFSRGVATAAYQKGAVTEEASAAGRTIDR